MKLSKNPPNTASFYQQQAAFCFEKGQYQQAIIHYKQAAEAFKQNEQFYDYWNVQNELAVCYIKLSKLDKSLQISQQVAQATQKKAKELSPSTPLYKSYNKLLIDANSNIFYIYDAKGNFDKSVYYSHQTLQLCLTFFGENSEETAFAYHNHAAIYFRKTNLDKALDYYEKSLLIKLKTLGEQHLSTATTYYCIAIVYAQKGDFQQSVYYIQKSSNIRLQLLGEQHPSLAPVYGSMATIHTKKGELKTALHYLQKRATLNKDIFGENHLQTAAAYRKLGDIHRKIKQFDESLFYLQKALDTQTALLGTAHRETVRTYYLLGLTHQDNHQLSKAQQYYKKALQNFDLITDDYNEFIVQTYLQLGQIAKQKKDWQKQLQYYQQALNILIDDFNSTHIYQNPPLEAKAHQLTYLIEVLSSKAQAFFHLFQQQTTQFPPLQALTTAYQTYQLIIQYITRLRRSYKAEGSKLLLAKETQKIFENALLTTHQLLKNAPANTLAYQQEMFYISEQSKAIVLLSNLQETQAKTLAHIPKDLLQQEKEYQIELNFLAKSIAKQEAKKEKKDIALFRQFQSQYLDYKRRYDQLIEQFEHNYPDYFQLKHNTKVVSITDIRQQLSSDGVLLSYFIGEKNYFIFIISKDEFDVYELPKAADFEEKIYRFTQAIDHHNKRQFIALSQQIYHWLIAPVADILLDPFEEIAHKPLIIIPHGILNYLPFEALIYESPPPNSTYKDLSFLVKQCVISYHYSTTLWLHGLQKNPHKKALPNSFAGFAPIYSTPTNHVPIPVQLNTQSTDTYAWLSRSNALSETAWKPLPYSKVEVQNVQQLFNKQGYESNIFLYKKANKTNFIQQATQAKFILIAAHGLVNDELPDLSGLVFHPTKTTTARTKTKTSTSSIEDSILSMKEAYLLHLQADLVVLSSCESGIGQLAKGEGMMAMNRGFLYSGASNVIFTLFKVYDKPSSELIHLLFKYILEGQSYASALRNAKLAFVQKNLADPKLWTAYVLLGHA